LQYKHTIEAYGTAIAEIPIPVGPKSALCRHYGGTRTNLLNNND